MEDKKIIVTTTDLKQDYEILDLIMDIQIKSRNVISQVGAGVKSMFGGNIGSYDKLFKKMREDALVNVQQQALAMGADAVIMIRYESAEVASLNAFQVALYGTAVKFK